MSNTPYGDYEFYVPVDQQNLLVEKLPTALRQIANFLEKGGKEPDLEFAIEQRKRPGMETLVITIAQRDLSKLPSDNLDVTTTVVDVEAKTASDPLYLKSAEV